MLSTDGKAKLKAAKEILRDHSPEQVAQILGWCDVDMRAAIESLQRAGYKPKREPSIGERYGFDGPPPPRQEQRGPRK